MRDRKAIIHHLIHIHNSISCLKIIPFPENKYIQLCYLQIIYYVQLLFYFSLGVLLYFIYQHILCGDVMTKIPFNC